MKNIYVLSFSIIVIGIVSLFGCKTTPDFSTYIDQLDSTLVTINIAELQFQEIDNDATNNLIQTVSANMKFIELNFKGEMERSMAKSISEYNTSKKLVKKFGTKHKSITKEIDRTKNQLSNLNDAFKQKATHDKDGNEFTKEYCEKVVTQEVKIANQMVEQINLMIEQNKMAHLRYEQYKDEMNTIISSIKEE